MHTHSTAARAAAEVLVPDDNSAPDSAAPPAAAAVVPVLAGNNTPPQAQAVAQVYIVPVAEAVVIAAWNGLPVSARDYCSPDSPRIVYSALFVSVVEGLAMDIPAAVVVARDNSVVVEVRIRLAVAVEAVDSRMDSTVPGLVAHSLGNSAVVEEEVGSSQPVGQYKSFLHRLLLRGYSLMPCLHLMTDTVLDSGVYCPCCGGGGNCCVEWLTRLCTGLLLA